MFRKMRRARQQITTEECAEILKRASSGVLAVYGDEGYPYAVPLSFVYEEGKDGSLGTIGFHCAKDGHKIDAIRRNEKVCFTVIDRDEVMPKERTTKFCSVIVFGRARILEREEELRRAANTLGAKYSAGFEALYMQETEETIREGRLCCVEITIDHMTGKIGREVMKERAEKERRTVRVAAAVIRDGERIFATQRGYGAYKDWWEFPGGKIEPGETAQEALVREIREELDADIMIEEPLMQVEYDYPDFHLSMTCYWCRMGGGQLTLLEHEAARWLSPGQLREVNWLPADMQVIGKIEAAPGAAKP